MGMVDETADKIISKTNDLQEALNAQQTALDELREALIKWNESILEKIK